MLSAVFSQRYNLGYDYIHDAIDHRYDEELLVAILLRVETQAVFVG